MLLNETNSFQAHGGDRMDSSRPHADALYSIGEFSRMTGITVKALRFYHEQGVIVPATIDPQTGYRHYTRGQTDLARAVRLLRDLQFPVKEIREILARRANEERMIDALERQQAALEEKIRSYRQAVRSLREYIAAERTGASMASSYEITEKVLPPLLIAGIRTKGRYSDCGPLFGKLCRGARSGIGGSPMMLHYDMEYKEEDADFEACIPLKTQRDLPGASVRELAGGKCISLMHKGPYDQLGGCYSKIMEYARQHGYRITSPCREIYIKGPGMIFRGNPQKYLTEIQMLVEQT